MAEILLVNPRRRKKRSKARRKMSALQKKYFGGGARKRRRRKSTSVAAAPRRRRRKSTSVAKYASNPRRRRSLTRSFKSSRRRRSNPSLRLGSIPSRAIAIGKSGFTGAAGALVGDLAWGYGRGWLPDVLATSPLAQYALKLALAVGVGLVGEKLWRGKGREMAVGAATVTLHDALKAQIQASFPDVKLGEYLTFAPTVGTMEQPGRLMSTGMGQYMDGLPNAVGYETDSSGYYGSGNGDFSGDGISGY